MPAVSLAPIFNATTQFTAGGVPLSGGLLATALAGTSTPALTYTDSAGTIANSNPIVLGSDGRPPSEIWLVVGTAYKFTLTDSLGLNPYTFDNIIGIGASTSGSGAFATLDVTGNSILGHLGSNTVSIGNGNALFDGSGYLGIGVTPTAGQGLIQLLGSANSGIKIGNTNNATVTVLDWYEEGAWTPALKMGGLFGTTTYSSQVGKFTRIGNIVHFWGLVQINVYDGSTGGITFSATSPIPYAAVAGTYPAMVVAQGITLTSPGWFAPGYVGGSGAPDIGLRLSSTAGSVSALAGTNVTLANGATIIVSGSYPVV